MIWWWGGFSCHEPRTGHSERNAPGFVPKGRGPPTRRRRQRRMGTRAGIHSQARAQILRRISTTPITEELPHKGRPRRIKGPGSIAGWVRGWGLGGTPPGAVRSTRARRRRFLRAKLFSGCPAPRAPPPLRACAMRNIDRQVDMPAIRKFEISQMDAKSSLAAPAALDHIAGPDREPAGQVICERRHVKILLESNNPRGTCRHQCPTTATVPRRRSVRPRFL
jgi:hypothetical protein